MASHRPFALLLTLALTSAAAAAPQEDSSSREAELPVYTHWRTYGLADGLPSERVLSVAARGDEVWAGTEGGLARWTGKRWQALTTADGLVNDVVAALCLCEETGDLWIGTMGGLARYSGGRFDRFTQLDSGLINDVVYGVATVGGDVWAATASGTSVYHPDEKRWELYNHENTVMHEPWCYGVTSSPERVYLAVWAAGVIEHDPLRRTWKAYRDPDGEMEIDLVRDDGLVHDVISGVSWDGGVLWASTYFGVSRYDGRTWRSWLEHESPLPSNFVNFVRAAHGWAWFATDRGLAASDGVSWVVYRAAEEPPGGTIAIHRADGSKEELTLEHGLSHNFLYGTAPQPDRVWAATARGLALGSRAPLEPTAGLEQR